MSSGPALGACTRKNPRRLQSVSAGAAGPTTYLTYPTCLTYPTYLTYPTSPTYRGRIVVSFLSVPGDTVRYLSALSTTWSIEKPSSFTCTRIVCAPLCAK